MVMTRHTSETTETYTDLLKRKRLAAQPVGFTPADDALPTVLFPFQAAITRWAIQRGRAAVFADTGLGKTLIELTWAREIAAHTGQPVLIVAPLAVGQQIAADAETKLALAVTICRAPSDVRPGVNITNYELIERFTPDAFGGLVLDESSRLKAYDGKQRALLTDFAQTIPFRLAATATPAPNDITEIVNHAEFLSVMQGKEILALFFKQDGNTTHQWRLKGHAQDAFWRWLASWAVAIRKPSDLGFSDAGYDLPPLTIDQHIVPSAPMTGRLFAVEAETLGERLQARRESVDARVALCADIVNNGEHNGEPWLVWCNLNSESEALAAAIPDAVEVTGSDSPERKTQAMLDFAAGRVRVLISKPTICGFGMNWQHCHHVAFVGLSDSFEQTYQAIRRCWRFGQTMPVDVHYITAEAEGAVVSNIQRKEREASAMMDSLVSAVSANADAMLRSASKQSQRDEMEYRESEAHGRDWTLFLGDSALLMDSIETDSVGLTVTSVPFPNMYAYTNSPHDVGNTRDSEEMLDQLRFIVGRDKLLRATMPGRMACVHLTQTPIFKHQAGYVGMRDFRGEVIRLMIDEGWIYYGEVTIDKDPQVKAQRTKERGLMFKTLATDSSHMRMAMADYVLLFRKPGENPNPIRAGRSTKYGNADGWITNEEWIEWAHPVWYSTSSDPVGGISETDVLPARQAREAQDELHLCPLQLPVIERCVKLWSAPGDLVMDPFNGIGSTGVKALELHRRYVGVELKESYFRQASRNLSAAEKCASVATLWDESSADDEVTDDSETA